MIKKVVAVSNILDNAGLEGSDAVAVVRTAVKISPVVREIHQELEGLSEDEVKVFMRTIRPLLVNKTE